jgi:hypothetical protein
VQLRFVRLTQLPLPESRALRVRRRLAKFLFPGTTASPFFPLSIKVHLCCTRCLCLYRLRVFRCRCRNPLRLASLPFERTAVCGGRRGVWTTAFELLGRGVGRKRKWNGRAGPVKGRRRGRCRAEGAGKRTGVEERSRDRSRQECSVGARALMLLQRGRGEMEAAAVGGSKVIDDGTRRDKEHRIGSSACSMNRRKDRKGVVYARKEGRRTRALLQRKQCVRWRVDAGAK